jgi:hypothetical protein
LHSMSVRSLPSLHRAAAGARHHFRSSARSAYGVRLGLWRAGDRVRDAEALHVLSAAAWQFRTAILKSGELAGNRIQAKQGPCRPRHAMSTRRPRRKICGALTRNEGVSADFHAGNCSFPHTLEGGANQPVCSPLFAAWREVFRTPLWAGGGRSDYDTARASRHQVRGPPHPARFDAGLSPRCPIEAAKGAVKAIEALYRPTFSLNREQKQARISAGPGHLS